MRKDPAKILDILKELNIGLSTLNQELVFLGLDEFDVNQRISSKDRDFIIAYFRTEQMKEIDNLRQNMAVLHNQLKSFYLKNNSDPSNMGELEEKQYFNFLLGKKNITAPNIVKYSEEAFWSLYNWYEGWMALSKPVQDKMIDATYQKIIEQEERKQEAEILYNPIDPETEIMSALRHREGDKFGY